MDAQTTGINDIWEDDLLDRKKDAVFLHTFLIGKMAQRQSNGISGSYVMNIDADWGAGKTFFLDRFGMHLEKQGHLVVNVNAWRDDYVDDPFVAVLSAIDAALKPYIKQTSGFKKYIQHAKKNASSIILNAGKGALKAAAKRYLDSEITELIQSKANDTAQPLIEGAKEAATKEIDKLTDKFTDQIINKFTEQNKASIDFRANLGNALKVLNEKSEVKLPLFILIDELDRCRPTYALALLERVKHLFDIDNIVFVFATNSGQLQHSITGAYGPSFDGYRYLKRFFEKTYKLKNGSIDAFVRIHAGYLKYDCLSAPGNGSIKSRAQIIDFLSLCTQKYGLEPREIQHIFDIILNVNIAWPYRTPIDLVVLFPLATHYYKHGNTNIKECYEGIPKELRVYFSTLNDGTTHWIIVKDAFSYFETGSNSKQSASRIINHRASSKTYDYVGAYFQNQINNVFPPEDISLFHHLPYLIEKAGQLREEDFVDDTQ